MSKKHKMVNSAIVAIKNNKDGAYRTQNDRRTALVDMAKTLYNLGYKLDHLRYMKPKHIEALVQHWKANGDTAGSMKNRMSHIRWLMRKFDGKIHMVPSNDNLGIPKRVYVTNEDKSRTLNETDLNKIQDPLMRHSLKGQELFGLRVETSLKIQPYVADAGQYLFIKKGWAKGSKEGMIPILTQEQRDWLEEAKQLVKSKTNSLIPPNLTYIKHRRNFETKAKEAGICHMHGHRHLYAQRRYKELTGWEAPVKGGLTRSEMTKEQKWQDHAVRLQISLEMLHQRKNVLNTYLGKK